MKYHRIPSETIRRLPTYLRALLFAKEQGAEFISSSKLAENLHLKPAQVRKDFSYFGAFGIKGVGYRVQTLVKKISGILKLDKPQKAALVGAGRLGTAIALYQGFRLYRFDIAAVFDANPKKIGRKIGAISIEAVSNIKTLRKKGIRLAIIAVPSEAAQGVTESLVKAGVTGILNLAPAYLQVPKKVKVVTIDIATELGILPYYT